MYAELIAIAEALSYVNSIDHDKVVILTDCRSALQHLARCTSTFRGTPIAYTILRIILILKAKGKSLTLQWIPSHVNILGNEKVDELAKEASVDGVPFSVRPFYTDCMHFVKNNCFNLWKEFFDERCKEKGIWYKTIQPEPMCSPWIDNCALNRSELITAMRLRCGHIPLNKFAFMMRKVPSPNCTECGMVEDVYHILMECVRNESLRRQIYDNNMFVDVGGCNSALAFPLSERAKALYKIVKFGITVRN